MITKPIENKQRERKLKRTQKWELKVLEIEKKKQKKDYKGRWKTNEK